MKKKVLLLVIVVVVTLFSILVVSFTGSPDRAIDVKVIGMYAQNDRFFVNVTIKNNQDASGWIDDVYLSTVQSGSIEVTGAGEGYAIEPGKQINLTLMTSQVFDGVTNAPFTLTYTAYPSGIAYTVII